MIDQLRHESATALDVRFASGAMPMPVEFQGDCLGCFLAWNDDLPWPVWLTLRFARALLFDWRGWRGKRFIWAGDDPVADGWNLFPRRGADDDLRYPFQAYQDYTLCDGRLALRLNYGVYPSAMRWVRDDLRQIGEKLWLGKMWLVWRERRLFVGFFALWKEGSCESP